MRIAIIFITMLDLIGMTVSPIIAREKGKDPLEWFFKGFFFGIFGIIFICVSKDPKITAKAAFMKYMISNPYEYNKENQNNEILNYYQKSIIKKNAKDWMCTRCGTVNPQALRYCKKCYSTKPVDD